MKLSLLDRISNKMASAQSSRPIVSKLNAPLASISFDDIPYSAARIGGPILAAAKVQATYYVCGGHSGLTFEGRPQHEVSDLVNLAQAGHEIACHTYGHPNVVNLDNTARLKDAAANASFIQEQVCTIAPSSFAYPFGRVSTKAKAFYSQQFLTCRGVYSGVNHGTMDFSELRAVGIESRSHDMGRVRDYIDKAKATNGWLIFFTHDVDPNPTPHGCRPCDLEDVILALQDANIATLTVRDAAQRVIKN